MRQHFMVGLLLVTVLLSCNKDNDAGADLKEQVKTDLRYGSYKRNTLDLYLPRGRGANTPLLILIHGGGWTSGDKEIQHYLQESLSEKGIATVSINYRLANEKVHYEEMMADISTAVQYCSNNCQNWSVSKDKMLVGGTSAGGHLALLYAYRYERQDRIAGVISLCGLTDVTDLSLLNTTYLPDGQQTILSVIEKMVGAKHTPGIPLNERFREASPRLFIRNIPTLMFHGTADSTVPYSQALALAADLDSARFPYKLVPVPDAGHDMGIGDPVYYQLLITEMENWCRLYGR